jgi:hypothetical protein
MFRDCYLPDDRDREIFGARYNPPKEFVHGEWYSVARFPKTSEDGHEVEIDECRWPSRFFRLRALPTFNSIQESKPGFTLSTGSGDDMGRLLVQVAEAIANGMLGLR